MKLHALMHALDLDRPSGPAELELADLSDDSRQIGPGMLFVCRGRAGDAHLDRYASEAVRRGAPAVLTPQKLDLPEHVAVLVPRTGQVVDQPLAGHAAEQMFDHPSQKLRLIGITGTNGKTTVAYLVQHLLKHAGLPCGLIGTVAVDDGSPDGPVPAELTTPGAIECSRLLARMVQNGVKACVAEVSSHALDQGRTAALGFDVGVFTNLTGDHLDYHGTMETYATAKARLFEQLRPGGWAILNQDDAWAGRMAEAARSAGAAVVDCHVRGEERRTHPRPATPHTASAMVLEMSAAASRVRLDGPWGSIELDLPLVGRHNASNALQAVAAANVLGPLDRRLRQALMSCRGVPGRLEPVTAPRPDESAPTVLVDYAHTHDALENVLLALRPVTAGRLIAVFGCGGDRDRTKRPKMADVACRLADSVVVTSDNPRTEDPQAIIDDILKGIPAGTDVQVQVDRAVAIAAAVRDAQPGDTVLIAGKGHEDYQIVGHTKHPFDDRRHAATALARWQEEAHGACRLSN